MSLKLKNVGLLEAMVGGGISLLRQLVIQASFAFIEDMDLRLPKAAHSSGFPNCKLLPYLLLETFL